MLEGKSSPLGLPCQLIPCSYTSTNGTITKQPLPPCTGKQPLYKETAPGSRLAHPRPVPAPNGADKDEQSHGFPSPAGHMSRGEATGRDDLPAGVLRLRQKKQRCSSRWLHDGICCLSFPPRCRWLMAQHYNATSNLGYLSQKMTFSYRISSRLLNF